MRRDQPDRQRRYFIATSLAALLAKSAFAFTPPRAVRGGATAVKSRTQVDGILFYGQSNAGAGGSAKAVLTAPVFPDTTFAFRGAQQTYGATLVDVKRLQGLGQVQDRDAYAPFPATAMAYALGRNNSSLGRRHFMHTVWYGGQPLAAFQKGSAAWLDLVAVARRMREALLDEAMDARIAALVLIQGESGPPGREVYARALTKLLDETLPELRNQTGQAAPPLAILLQTNASNIQQASAKDVALAQWDVARARSHDTTLAGPMYQFPLNDAVHQSAIGRMMLGDLLALAYQARVERGETFEPLHPTSARLDSNVIRIAFKRPAESQPLQWDRSWMPAVPNFGFSVNGPNGAVEIASVEITGPSDIAIHLAGKNDSRILTVRYAMEQPPEKGWAPGRGQLMAPTARRSAFADLKAGAPEFISHYCIRFEITAQ
ncbi:hypothetical protein [Terrarubrum flagellatum]|uniref:hypothetical protein n=1 Tax=Terrirubrum flagellatum TaxID=2895980 RepID=UPI003144D481